MTDDSGAMQTTFVCARCGREFAIPASVSGMRVAKRRLSRIVMLGGRPWCEKCADGRFRRRSEYDAALVAGLVSPDAVPTFYQPGAGRRGG